MEPKQADAMSAASPLPQVEVKTTLAPGKRGPVGIAPRTDYSRVNTGSPPAPDAGASEQKSMAPRGAEMLPKMASEGSMGQQVAARPTINEMVKRAMAGVASAVEVNREAARQAENLGEATSMKTAGAPTTSGSVDYDQVEKLAAACEFAAQMVKEGAHLGGPYSLHENHVEPGKGPGALTVLTPQGGENPIKPGGTGHGHTAQVSAGAAMQKSTPAGPSTQLANDIDHAPGGPGRQQLSMVNQKHAAEEKCAKCGKDKDKCTCEKTASIDVAAIRASWAKQAGVKTAKDEHEEKETQGLVEAEKGLKKVEKAHESEPENKKEASNFLTLAGAALNAVKVAEDAINPAHISAGGATPPDTREAGQPGGVQPKGSGPGMVASSTSAIHYTKGQAKAEPKSDSGAYWREPSHSSATDKTLGQAFKHTGEAGTKFASAPVSTAAARALLQKLASAADANKKNEANGAA
jgi:hypothetical protein